MRESIFSGLFELIEYHSQRAFERHLPAATTERPVLIQEVRSSRQVICVGILLTAAPASALACPVCGFVGTSDNTWAYQAMSAMLTLLPLAMVGAIVWWLARLAGRADTVRPVGRAFTTRLADPKGPRHTSSVE